MAARRSGTPSTCPTDKSVRCRIVNVTEDGTVEVVPDHDVVLG